MIKYVNCKFGTQPVNKDSEQSQALTTEVSFFLSRLSSGNHRLWCHRSEFFPINIIILASIS